jgi:hypothetical protein
MPRRMVEPFRSVGVISRFGSWTIAGATIFRWNIGFALIRMHPFLVIKPVGTGFVGNQVTAD